MHTVYLLQNIYQNLLYQLQKVEYKSRINNYKLSLTYQRPQSPVSSDSSLLGPLLPAPLRTEVWQWTLMTCPIKLATRSRSKSWHTVATCFLNLVNLRSSGLLALHSPAYFLRQLHPRILVVVPILANRYGLSVCIYKEIHFFGVL